MSTTKPKPRRTRVERNVYRRPDGKFEIGYRDSTGRLRWQTIDGGITAARAARDDALGRKGKGERVQPNPRLRFSDAADAWLAGQVAELRPATQVAYRNAIDNHLRPRWGTRRLDTITVDQVAALVRELRAEGKSEWTIAGIVMSANRVFKFARRRLNWHGENPVSALENGERPKTASSQRRRIFRGDELAQTIATAGEPYATLFALAAVTGARLSECLGLTWGDVAMDDLEATEITFAFQVDRQGRRQPLKTEASQRTVEVPFQVAAMLGQRKLASSNIGSDAFVFATRSGRPLGQRNVIRALRLAQERAVDDRGQPTFPVLHQRDENGRPVPVPHGAVPSFHSFRHTAASEAISAGDSAEEVSWQLGHKSSVVTRAIYVQEIKNAERVARRRARMEARFGNVMETVDRIKASKDAPPTVAEVVEMPLTDDKPR